MGFCPHRFDSLVVSGSVLFGLQNFNKTPLGGVNGTIFSGGGPKKYGGRICFLGGGFKYFLFSPLFGGLKVSPALDRNNLVAPEPTNGSKSHGDDSLSELASSCTSKTCSGKELLTEVDFQDTAQVDAEGCILNLASGISPLQALSEASSHPYGMECQLEPMGSCKRQKRERKRSRLEERQRDEGAQGPSQQQQRHRANGLLSFVRCHAGICTIAKLCLVFSVFGVANGHGGIAGGKPGTDTAPSAFGHRCWPISESLQRGDLFRAETAQHPEKGDHEVGATSGGSRKEEGADFRLQGVHPGEAQDRVDQVREGEERFGDGHYNTTRNCGSSRSRTTRCIPNRRRRGGRLRRRHLLGIYAWFGRALCEDDGTGKGTRCGYSGDCCIPSTDSADAERWTHLTAFYAIPNPGARGRRAQCPISSKSSSAKEIHGSSRNGNQTIEDGRYTTGGRVASRSNEQIGHMSTNHLQTQITSGGHSVHALLGKNFDYVVAENSIHCLGSPLCDPQPSLQFIDVLHQPECLPHAQPFLCTEDTSFASLFLTPRSQKPQENRPLLVSGSPRGRSETAVLQRPASSIGDRQQPRDEYHGHRADLHCASSPILVLVDFRACRYSLDMLGSIHNTTHFENYALYHLL